MIAASYEEVMENGLRCTVCTNQANFPPSVICGWVLAPTEKKDGKSAKSRTGASIVDALTRVRQGFGWLETSQKGWIPRGASLVFNCWEGGPAQTTIRPRTRWRRVAYAMLLDRPSRSLLPPR
jgi:hypothetical protein